MGNREDLLAGARKVIVERGVAKATAREIATEAGVSLAAIGYHFGSKEQLVTEALTEALGSGIGDSLEALVLKGKGMPVLDAFAQMWNAAPQVFAANRDTLMASMENTVRVLRDPQASAALAEATRDGYLGMAEMLTEAHPELDAGQVEAVARLQYVLAQSLGILWLLSPEGSLPTGDDLAVAVAVLAGVEAGRAGMASAAAPTGSPV